MDFYLNPARTALLCIDQEEQMRNHNLYKEDFVRFNQMSRAQTNFTNYMAGKIRTIVMVGQRPGNGQKAKTDSTFSAWYDNKTFTVHNTPQDGLEPYDFDFMNPNFMKYKVCLKPFDSALKHTGLDTHLEHDDIDTNIIIGNYKSLCIYAAAADSVNKGFRTILVTDLIFEDPDYLLEGEEFIDVRIDRENNLQLLDESPHFIRMTSAELSQYIRMQNTCKEKPAMKAGSVVPV